MSQLNSFLTSRFTIQRIYNVKNRKILLKPNQISLIKKYSISEVHYCNYSIFRIRHTNVFYFYSVVTLVSWLRSIKRTAFTLLIFVTRSVHPEREIIYQSIFLPLFHSVFSADPIENSGYITWRLHLILNMNNLPFYILGNLTLFM